MHREGWIEDSFLRCEVEQRHLNRSLGEAGRCTEQASGRGFFPAEGQSGRSGCHRKTPTLRLKSMSL
ncbi:hypothetical protein GRJ2_002368400 [Grus japonensis]|uniref:Uncharacterized protein n=1 Tax=Grus japonensis TaxID=30415 RepID=A0ABC9XMV8_GRUJA